MKQSLKILEASDNEIYESFSSQERNNLLLEAMIDDKALETLKKSVFKKVKEKVENDSIYFKNIIKEFYGTPEFKKLDNEFKKIATAVSENDEQTIKSFMFKGTFFKGDKHLKTSVDRALTFINKDTAGNDDISKKIQQAKQALKKELTKNFYNKAINKFHKDEVIDNSLNKDDSNQAFKSFLKKMCLKTLGLDQNDFKSLHNELDNLDDVGDVSLSNNFINALDYKSFLKKIEEGIKEASTDVSRIAGLEDKIALVLTVIINTKLRDGFITEAASVFQNHSQRTKQMLKSKETAGLEDTANSFITNIAGLKAGVTLGSLALNSGLSLMTGGISLLAAPLFLGGVSFLGKKGAAFLGKSIGNALSKGGAKEVCDFIIKTITRNKPNSALLPEGLFNNKNILLEATKFSNANKTIKDVCKYLQQKNMYHYKHRENKEVFEKLNYYFIEDLSALLYRYFGMKAVTANTEVEQNINSERRKSVVKVIEGLSKLSKLNNSSNKVAKDDTPEFKDIAKIISLTCKNNEKEMQEKFNLALESISIITSYEILRASIFANKLTEFDAVIQFN